MPQRSVSTRIRVMPASKQMHRRVLKHALRYIVRIVCELHIQAWVVVLIEWLREATRLRLGMDDNVSTKDMLQKSMDRKARREEGRGQASSTTRPCRARKPLQCHMVVLTPILEWYFCFRASSIRKRLWIESIASVPRDILRVIPRNFSSADRFHSLLVQEDIKANPVPGQRHGNAAGEALLADGH